MVTFHFVCLFVTDIKSRKYPTQAFISKVKTRYLVIFITCLSKTVKWLEISTLHDILMLAWKIWPSGGGLKNELRWWDFSFEVVGFFIYGGRKVPTSSWNLGKKWFIQCCFELLGHLWTAQFSHMLILLGVRLQRTKFQLWGKLGKNSFL